MDEAERLREDISELRWLIDSVLDRESDRGLIAACTEVLRERQERLAELDQGDGAA